MNWRCFACVWGFVFAVAGYDVCFAWNYRDQFASWELNPLARWGVARFGLPSVCAFKFMSLAVTASIAGYCLSRDRRQLGRATTLIVAAAYGLLLIHYATSSQQVFAEPVSVVAQNHAPGW